MNPNVNEPQKYPRRVARHEHDGGEVCADFEMEDERFSDERWGRPGVYMRALCPACGRWGNAQIGPLVTP